MITTINPADGTTLATYQAMTPAQIEQAVVQGSAAAAAWGRTPVENRLEALTRLAGHLRSESARLAALITAEMGKPIKEAEGEIEKSAVTAEYYAANGGAILADEEVPVDGVRAWVAYEPVGLVLAVMPWNFPAWQVFRFAVPTLAAGNGVLLKHSPNVTGFALELEKVFVEAGFGEHLVTTLVVDEPEVPATIEGLIADDRIAAVTLTGSNRAGAAVGAAAGRASKRSVLELGGSDAFVVLADADLEAAAAAAVRARFANSGQSCVCAKRFIVEAAVADEFIDRFVLGVKALAVGDPTDREVAVGPLARDDLRAVLQRQVDESVAAGAVLVAGGGNIDGPGYYFEPTVLTGTAPGMPAFDEETFGPLAAVAVAADVEEAITLANATQYGLGLSIWTGSPSRGVEVARQITSGAAFVNAVVASDPRLPFGGTKRSGYGRELAAVGIREFTNTRTYWVA
ncbi:succinate-semialdehyde dehydrogenase/glutarate-semialdehyde dehydrogenase [Kribbella orskensis]|uniref:Succinate-semialdehyde dehydrogenase/glutarate-semialdehyde dehydrogenase n=1 Tax=Kribbella orskensis TaxID=2512216 RepID=A0ABY2BAA8_9ACTN|nr:MULTISPECIES: aldehyde dehydrogenase family protein [Kribbella]TCN30054.1 succinate-semialdehyde dehydrogenase/glutarate-semialdehyde dehydrogenase [Kribbella sp. VKM Ac-2500]TCO10236.1 succinate-semialdehyde dehydrogenase/glutarate-semialdehyde dehydrogenase [Kribbella orskensis]